MASVETVHDLLLPAETDVHEIMYSLAGSQIHVCQNMTVSAGSEDWQTSFH